MTWMTLYEWLTIPFRAWCFQLRTEQWATSAMKRQTEEPQRINWVSHMCHARLHMMTLLESEQWKWENYLGTRAFFSADLVELIGAAAQERKKILKGKNDCNVMWNGPRRADLHKLRQLPSYGNSRDGEPLHFLSLFGSIHPLFDLGINSHFDGNYGRCRWM